MLQKENCELCRLWDILREFPDHNFVPGIRALKPKIPKKPKNLKKYKKPEKPKNIKTEKPKNFF